MINEQLNWCLLEENRMNIRSEGSEDQAVVLKTMKEVEVGVG
jgi:hypothetical protein